MRKSAEKTPVLSFPAKGSSQAISNIVLVDVCTCAVYQTGFIWMVPYMQKYLAECWRPIFQNVAVHFFECLRLSYDQGDQNI